MAKSKKPMPTTFSDDDMRAFEPELKIGLLATINCDGLPHITVLSSLAASSPTQVVFGQFTEGLSKQHLRTNPRSAFLIMTLAKELWRGKATFTHTAQSGPEFERYNTQPMFRYNAYFGVHTVYYLDLVEHTGRTSLPMARIVPAAVATIAARTIARPPEGQPVLNHWVRRLFDKLDSLKFIATIGADGYPTIVPVIQAQTLDGSHVIFSLGAYGREIAAIPAGAPIALFGLELTMEDVLLRGVYQGIGRIGGVRCGFVAVDWVYNPMPPVPGQVYPPVPIAPVTRF